MKYINILFKIIITIFFIHLPSIGKAVSCLNFSIMPVFNITTSDYSTPTQTSTCTSPVPSSEPSSNNPGDPNYDPTKPRVYYKWSCKGKDESCRTYFEGMEEVGERTIAKSNEVINHMDNEFVNFNSSVNDFFDCLDGCTQDDPPPPAPEVTVITIPEPSAVPPADIPVAPSTINSNQQSSQDIEAYANQSTEYILQNSPISEQEARFDILDAGVFYKEIGDTAVESGEGSAAVELFSTAVDLIATSIAESAPVIGQYNSVKIILYGEDIFDASNTYSDAERVFEAAILIPSVIAAPIKFAVKVVKRASSKFKNISKYSSFSERVTEQKVHKHVAKKADEVIYVNNVPIPNTPRGKRIAELLAKNKIPAKDISRISGKIPHIFGKNLKKHKLEGFLNHNNGDEIAAFKKIENAARDIISNGSYSDTIKIDIVVNVDGFIVTSRTNIKNGIATTTTAFIP